MQGFVKHPLRVAGRSLWLVGACLWAALGYVVSVWFRGGVPLLTAQALWLQSACRRGLRILNLDLQTAGSIPLRGLLVSNHLSYLDVLVLSACAPCVFVAKREVRHWPVFGWFARLSGTVFVSRERRTQVAQSSREIQQALDSGALVVLFPEGTSSGGGTVLPFKSSLLEPALRSNHPVTAACIHYELADGDVAEEVCYWKDMTLLPHLLNLLSKGALRASVSFGEIRSGAPDRKELARQLHAQVLRLKEAACA